MRQVLMVAYHFPPYAGSSGIQRTLRFVQQLPSYGWQALVLTAAPRAYEGTTPDLLPEIPSGTVVERAFALDTARHLALGQRYIAAMARPDRWMSWQFDAVRRGMRMIRRYCPAAIWSTYPIATAHLIGAELQRRSGLPWLADFRDPMAQDGYPADPQIWQSFRGIEQRAANHSTCMLFTTPGAARTYRQRYPAAASRIVLLENGFDEESFAAVEATNADAEPLNPGLLTVLHSGIVYPSERDPAPFMAALGRLHAEGLLPPGGVRFRFRAAVHEDLLNRLAAQHGVQHLVETLPPLPYRQALAEMLRADALMVMQAGNCNEQIPAKVYEYFRAKRPILCLADPAGDTAEVMRSAGVEVIAKLDSTDDIAHLLPGFLRQLGLGQASLPLAEVVQGASRMQRSAALARYLDAAT